MPAAVQLGRGEADVGGVGAGWTPASPGRPATWPAGPAARPRRTAGPPPAHRPGRTSMIAPPRRHLALGQVVLGVRGEARVADHGHRRVALQDLGQALGGVALRAKRTRQRAQAAQAVGGVERARRWRPAGRRSTRSRRRARSLPATTPRVASLWPAMALVAEWRTRSTPCDERLLHERRGEGGVDHRDRALDGAELGRGRRGPAAGWPASRRTPAPSCRAARPRPGRRARCRRRTSSRCRTGRRRRPETAACRRRSASGRRCGHRASRGANTTLAVAPMPDANARAASAPSSSAMASSNALTVGLP